MARLPGKPGKIAVISKDGRNLVMPIPAVFTEDNPNWSPDGRALLFRGCRILANGENCAPQLFVFDLQSRELSPVPGSEGMGDRTWSPHGRYLSAHNAEGASMLIYDFQTRRWESLSKGALFGRSFWSRDSRSFCFQDFYGGVDQPVFRVSIPSRKIERVLSAGQTLPADATAFALSGLTLENAPLAILIRTDSDVYALDVELP
jgi:Tol biopolymer transport system component